MWEKVKWRHLVAKFAINASGAMLFSLVQVSESISGSVVPLAMFFLIGWTTYCAPEKISWREMGGKMFPVKFGLNWCLQSSPWWDQIKYGKSSKENLITILENGVVQIVKCICPNCQMYLSKLSNVFVSIFRCICQDEQIYLFKLQKWKEV